MALNCKSITQSQSSSNIFPPRVLYLPQQGLSKLLIAGNIFSKSVSSLPVAGWNESNQQLWLGQLELRCCSTLGSLMWMRLYRGTWHLTGSFRSPDNCLISCTTPSLPVGGILWIAQAKAAAPSTGKRQWNRELSTESWITYGVAGCHELHSSHQELRGLQCCKKTSTAPFSMPLLDAQSCSSLPQVLPS